MNKKIITGLREVYKNYDTFFIDLWGVMHNGIELYPEAIKAVKNLDKLKKKFIFMSNAPRPSKNVEKFLLSIKMEKTLTKNVFTSGEAALKSLKEKRHGKNFYHLGPKRDAILFQSFKKNKKDLKDADFILCTGLFDGKENSLNFYKNLLKKYVKIKMICTNPDLIVHRGNKKEYCAGKLAEIFKKLGGKVVYYGKPYPEIYKFCIKKKENILVIGDNIRTDIKGANNMKLDSLFITHGIHKDSFTNIQIQEYDKFLNKYKAKTNYYQKRLIW